jgi:hypothetical protein
MCNSSSFPNNRGLLSADHAHFFKLMISFRWSLSHRTRYCWRQNIAGSKTQADQWSLSLCLLHSFNRTSEIPARNGIVKLRVRTETDPKVWKVWIRTNMNCTYKYKYMRNLCIYERLGIGIVTFGPLKAILHNTLQNTMRPHSTDKTNKRLCFWSCAPRSQ